MSTDASIDWFQVIAQINRAGIGNADLAAIVGVPRSTLLGWKQGAEPKYLHGERLVSAWERITLRERDDLPRVTKQDWWAYHSVN